MASSVFGALYRAFGSPAARRPPLLTGMEWARSRRSEALLEISEQSVFVENYPLEDPANGPLCVVGVTAFVMLIVVFAGSGRCLVTGSRCFSADGERRIDALLGKDCSAYIARPSRS